jgi:NAD(P)-dependent dehydrogenase (short-subunit alcohol dehydrogenase family)
VLADWNEKEVQTAAKDLASKGHQTLAVCCDVSDDAQVEAMTVAKFGQLDAAYNNAGVQNVLPETADSPRDDYDRVMSINLRGVWNCMKFRAPADAQARQRSDRELFFTRRPQAISFMGRRIVRALTRLCRPAALLCSSCRLS